MCSRQILHLADSRYVFQADTAPCFRKPRLRGKSGLRLNSQPRCLQQQLAGLLPHDSCALVYFSAWHDQCQQQRTALLFLLAHTASSVYWGNLFDLAGLSQVNKGPSVNVFETTIRILGGLLSAYALTKEQVYLDGAKVTCRLQLLLHCAVPHAYTQYCCTMHDRYCCTQLS